ncbi:MAG: hypothetical protein GX149_00825, partial [Acholeplasmataceae bacterium]|nr:hypothetical protein [Acholeplasmataceae bacterium]
MKTKNVFKNIKSMIRLFCVILVVVLFFAVFNVKEEIYSVSYRSPATASTFMSEAGTEEDPYVIGSVADMVELSN